MNKRRILKIFSYKNFVVVKRYIVLLTGTDNTVVVRVVSLDYNSSGIVPLPALPATCVSS